MSRCLLHGLLNSINHRHTLLRRALRRVAASTTIPIAGGGGAQQLSQRLLILWAGVMLHAAAAAVVCLVCVNNKALDHALGVNRACLEAVCCVLCITTAVCWFVFLVMLHHSRPDVW